MRTVPGRWMGVVWLLLAACGGGDEEGTSTGPVWPTTCDAVDTQGTCYAWGGEQTADHDAFADLCETTYDGVYGDDACPDAGVVGRCDTDQGAGLLLTYVYYEGSYDAASAQAHCEGLASCAFSCVFSAG